MDLRTLICLPAKSTSCHFRPNSSLIRSPVPAANKSLLSITQTVSESVDFGRQKHFWYCPPFRALADEGDRIAFDEVVSSGVVKEHAHQIPNLGATSSDEWKRSEPQLNFDCPDCAEISCTPPRHDPLAQVALVCDPRG